MCFELPRIAALADRGILTLTDLASLLDVKRTDRLVHAGPLELREFVEGAPWEMSAWAKAQQPPRQ
jgi:hypothetical protein